MGAKECNKITLVEGLCSMSASKVKSLLNRNDSVIRRYTILIFKLMLDVKLVFKLKSILFIKLCKNTKIYI